MYFRCSDIGKFGFDGSHARTCVGGRFDSEVGSTGLPQEPVNGGNKPVRETHVSGAGVHGAEPGV